MHPRNAYTVPPHWAALVAQDASLQAYAGRRIDVREPSTLRALTSALLRRDFGIECEMAAHHLCPTLPNRCNYIHWMEDVLEASGVAGTDVHGLDIGTGHVAIYALLLCALHPTWHMTGTDTDSEALAWAQRIVHDPRNAHHAWQERVHLVHSEPRPLLRPSERPYTFVLCNPPFYASLEERATLIQSKAEYVPPCEATESELCTPGGEVAFVTQLLEESAKPMHRERTAWYSSMLGRLSSVAALVPIVRTIAPQYALTELVQGKTRRWALAWSFRPARVPDTLARAAGASLQAYLPPSNTRTWPHAHSDITTLAAQLRAMPTLPPDAVDWEGPLSLAVWTPCWTRSARRARARGDEGVSRGAAPLLRLQWTVLPTHILVHWTYGTDRVLFDSLCTHLWGQLRST